MEIFSHGVQPLANAFCKAGEPRPGHVPLRVMLCKQCGLAQLGETVDPSVLYRDYPYITSKGPTMRAHFEALLEHMGKGRTVESIVEIGSNTGEFLVYCRGRGVQDVAGIDPAQNLSDIANKRGVFTTCGLFNEASAEASRSLFMPEPSVVVARHVFAHCDDWADFMHSLDVLCGPTTSVFIECPWVMDMLENTELDTAYSEHLSYVSIGAVKALCEGSKFKLVDVKKFPIHGGSIVMRLERNENAVELLSVGEFEAWELDLVPAWGDFGARAAHRIAELRKCVLDLNGDVAGLGASAKSTVWINACGLTKDDIRFIADETPAKQGRFSPGAEIPIVDEGALLRNKPSHAILFAWNFLEDAMKKHAAYLDAGGKFIIPVPRLEIVP